MPAVHPNTQHEHLMEPQNHTKSVSRFRSGVNGLGVTKLAEKGRVQHTDKQKTDYANEQIDNQTINHANTQQDRHAYIDTKKWYNIPTGA